MILGGTRFQRVRDRSSQAFLVISGTLKMCRHVSGPMRDAASNRCDPRDRRKKREDFAS
jgi:hypothetical protein